MRTGFVTAWRLRAPAYGSARGDLGQKRAALCLCDRGKSVHLPELPFPRKSNWIGTAFLAGEAALHEVMHLGLHTAGLGKSHY